MIPDPILDRLQHYRFLREEVSSAWDRLKDNPPADLHAFAYGLVCELQGLDLRMNEEKAAEGERTKARLARGEGLPGLPDLLAPPSRLQLLNTEFRTLALDLLACYRLLSYRRSRGAQVPPFNQLDRELQSQAETWATDRVRESEGTVLEAMAALLIDRGEKYEDPDCYGYPALWGDVGEIVDKPPTTCTTYALRAVQRAGIEREMKSESWSEEVRQEWINILTRWRRSKAHSNTANTAANDRSC